jgi:hypothetical protein
MKNYESLIDNIKSDNDLYNNFHVVLKCKHYMDETTLMPILRRTTNE